MNIQITSLYYRPENFRINDIAETLAANGHMVRVLTGLPDYSTGKIAKEYRLFRRRREVINSVFVRRVPIVARRMGVFFRAINYLSFVITGSLHALFTGENDYDVILSNGTSPVFQILPAIVYQRRRGKKLVLYCYDVWPESLKAWDVPEQSALFRAVWRASSWIYRQCDIVAVTSLPFCKYLAETCGVDEKKIVYLPQYAEDIFADTVGQYEENGCIDFLFAGNIGAVQGLDCVLQAVLMIKSDKAFCVHIVGGGSELNRLKALAEELHLGQLVIFHGKHPFSDMPQFYKMADCLLMTLRGGDYIGMTLPGKAQEYLCAGKPILAAIDGAGREMMEDADCGEVVPAGDYVALAAKMELIIEDFVPYRAKGLNGRKYYERYYTKNRFMYDLLKLLGT